MKRKNLFIILFLLFSASIAEAQSIPVTYLQEFTWNANTDNTIGYRLYRSDVSGLYTDASGQADQSKMVADIKGIGTTNVQVQVPAGIWYFVLTAYNYEQMESGFSTEAERRIIPPNVPQNFRHLIVIPVNIVINNNLGG